MIPSGTSNPPANGQMHQWVESKLQYRSTIQIPYNGNYDSAEKTTTNEDHVLHRTNIYIYILSFMNNNIHLFFLSKLCHILNVFVLILISMQNVNDEL
jgi:hypothetical protein